MLFFILTFPIVTDVFHDFLLRASPGRVVFFGMQLATAAPSCDLIMLVRLFSRRVVPPS